MNLNKVFLGGRIANELEIKKTQSGISYLRMSIAVNRPKKKDEEKPVCDFVNCTVWGDKAEMVYKYFRKGSQILAVGTIQTGSYEKDGKRISSTNINLDEIHFIDSAKVDTPKTEVKEKKESTEQFFEGLDDMKIEPIDPELTAKAKPKKIVDTDEPLPF